MKDHTETTKEKLEELKDEINANLGASLKF